ncbi:hypothetical protein ACDX78_02075 [Virgibacillus oceani]
MNASEGKVIEFPGQSDGVIGGKRKRSHLNHAIPINEIAATSNHQYNGGEKMDDSKILEKYMEKVDTDRRETEKHLLDDARERETRLREETINREERFNESLKNYQKESKEREERFIAVIEKLENKIVEENEKMKASLEKSEQKIDDSVKNLESMKRTNFWGQVAFIIGISAIIVTFITQM